MAAGADDFVVNGAAAEVRSRIAVAIERRRVLGEVCHREMIREQFLADAAHELRRPVSTLAWHARILGEKFGHLTPDATARCLEAIRHDSDFLLNLIDDLLDLCRLQAGGQPVELGPVPIERTVRGVLERQPPRGNRHVLVDIEPGYVALAEARLLSQILANILSNAYRYGGPTIRFVGQRKLSHVVVAVEDDGPGVPAEFVDSLFEPFQRGVDADTVSGAGLGLALSRRLARAQGGDVRYVPLSGLGGARFEVWLQPLDSAADDLGGSEMAQR
jgi:signal transduction histidine kinase